MNDENCIVDEETKDHADEEMKLEDEHYIALHDGEDKSGFMVSVDKVMLINKVIKDDKSYIYLFGDFRYSRGNAIAYHELFADAAQFIKKGPTHENFHDFYSAITATKPSNIVTRDWIFVADENAAYALPCTIGSDETSVLYHDDVFFVENQMLSQGGRIVHGNVIYSLPGAYSAVSAIMAYNGE